MLLEQTDGLGEPARFAINVGKEPDSRECVGVVESERVASHIPRPYQLADGGRPVTEKEIAGSKGVANGSLDNGAVGEIGGDTWFGNVQRFSDSGNLAYAPCLAFGPRGRHDFVLEKGKHRVGL